MIKYATIIVILLLCFGGRAYGENAFFVDNFADALAMSESTNKPLLVVFTADWCKYCAVLHEDVQKESGGEILKDYIVCFINIDKYPDIYKEYKVKALPDSRIIVSKTEIATNIGYKSKTHYMQWIKNVNRKIK